MGDRTYGTLRVLDVPPWTQDDEDRLGLLEAAFDQSGGRGVDTAEALDLLHIRKDGLDKYLEDNSWLSSDVEGETDRTFNQEEISCGYVTGDYDGVIRTLEAWGCSFAMWEDPKFEWLGSLHMFTPALGCFGSECDADGNTVLSPVKVRALVAAHKDDPATLGPALLQEIGQPWLDKVDLIDQHGGHLGDRQPPRSKICHPVSEIRNPSPSPVHVHLRRTPC